MRRINPKTKKPYKRGDKRSDGEIFNRYSSNKGTDGYFQEIWYSKEFIHRVKLRYRRTKRTTRRKPGFKNLKNNISLDYLFSILPEDKKCPVFGFEMGFGGDLDSSPSIDRIDPYEGYIKGNVIWISYLANRMKSDLSLDEIIKIGKWAKRQIKHQNEKKIKS